MTTLEMIAKKGKEKISMVTCYDYTSALLVAQTSVDCVLVGDSLANTMHGHPTTLPATVPMMALHTQAVSRALGGKKLLIGDLPFLSYRQDLRSNVRAAGRLMTAGAQALKLEGARGNLDLIRHLTDSGIPMMGHLGLTPQSVHQLGGFKVQGKNPEAYDRILKDAHDLEEAGCFSIVLECVPEKLGEQITRELKIPTIGIGAGAGTDGQVLVWQDLLGLNEGFRPKFVRPFAELGDEIKKSLNDYDSQVKNGSFPGAKESYT